MYGGSFKNKYQVAGRKVMTNETNYESYDLPNILTLTTPKAIDNYNTFSGTTINSNKAIENKPLPITPVTYYTADAKKLNLNFQTANVNGPNKINIPTTIYSTSYTSNNIANYLSDNLITENDTAYFSLPESDLRNYTYSQSAVDYMNTLITVPENLNQVKKEISVDKSPIVNLHITKAPEKAKFLQNLNVSQKFISNAFKLAKKYDISPYELMAACLIETAEKKTITADMYFNTHDYVRKKVEKLGIPTAKEAFVYLNKYGKPTKDGKTPDTAKILFDFFVAEAKIDKKAYNLEKKVLDKAINVWYPAIKKIEDEVADNADSYMELLAMFIKDFGLHNVNSDQESNSNVNHSYVDMVTTAADYLKTIPAIKNFKIN